jgi:hypothetical protein
MRFREIGTDPVSYLCEEDRHCDTPRCRKTLDGRLVVVLVRH